MGCAIVLAGASIGPAHADYKKVAPNTRSQVQIAKEECSSHAMGSEKVILGTIGEYGHNN